MKPRRIDILGVPVDCVNMQEAVSVVEGMIGGSRPSAVIAVNPEKVIKAQRNRELLAQLHAAGLLIPDGIGVVIAARLLHSARIERVPGSELMPAICAKAAEKGYRIFLFGSDPEVNCKTRDIIARRYPGIMIVGNRDGYVTEDGMPLLIDEINSSGAEILFIALGSPKQEIWMERYLNLTNVKVCQGVGGTFDVIAGKVRRAPLIFRRVHLEWLFRLLSNPRRMLRQTALPKFMLAVLKRKLISR